MAIGHCPVSRLTSPRSLQSQEPGPRDPRSRARQQLVRCPSLPGVSRGTEDWEVGRGK